jgi:hypothetical protein
MGWWSNLWSKKHDPLLPDLKDLRDLSDGSIKILLDTVSADRERELRYATLGLKWGAISLLAALIATCYLEANGQSIMARFVLGTSVLSTVGKMITGRLFS